MRVSSPASRGVRSLSAIAISASLAALLAGCGSTTYGTGESAEIAVFKELGGSFAVLGVGGKKEKEIEYGPRAPLVMPPEKNLRPPVETASSDPNWPEPYVEEQGRGFASESRTSSDRLSQEEVARQRELGKLLNEQTQGREYSENDNERLQLPAQTVKEQREAFQQGLASINVDTGERKYLTQPPDSVREPAADQPTEFEDIEVKSHKRTIWGRWFR